RVGLKPKIFLDKGDLRAGDTLNGKIAAALDQSLLFIPVLSPGYLASEWCRKEFLYFMDKHKKRLFLDNSSRIVPLKFMPYEAYVPESAWASEVKTIMDFLEGKEILYKDFYRDPLPLQPDHADFRKEVAGFSKYVQQLIEKLEELASPPDDTTEAEIQIPATPAIFLGYAFGTEGSPALTLREGLLKEWQKQQKYGTFKHRLLPDDTPDAADFPRNKPEAEVRAFIQRQLRQSDCAVLVFDDVEGAKTTDTDVAVVHLQYRLALEETRSRPDFRVLVAAQPTEDCVTSQLDFIRETEKDARASERVLLAGFEVKTIHYALLEIINRPSAPPSPALTQSAFFIHDRRDRGHELYDIIDDIIFQQGYDVLYPVFREDDPLVDPDDYFKRFWLQSGRAIVLLRNGTTAWCNSVKVELLKLRTEKTVPGLMAICVTDPDAGQRLREVRSHEFMVIDCTKPGFQDLIVQFLKNAGHA
ncbi:MAG: hypothetical protein RLZ62_1308, partial [Bacteroidota bacterium]